MEGPKPPYGSHRPWLDGSHTMMHKGVDSEIHVFPPAMDYMAEINSCSKEIHSMPR